MIAFHQLFSPYLSDGCMKFIQNIAVVVGIYCELLMNIIDVDHSFCIPKYNLRNFGSGYLLSKLLWLGEHMLPLHWLLFGFWIVVLEPHFIDSHQMAKNSKNPFQNVPLLDMKQAHTVVCDQHSTLLGFISCTTFWFVIFLTHYIWWNCSTGTPTSSAVLSRPVCLS